MKNLIQKLGIGLLFVSLTLTACKKDQYLSTNSKRVKHQNSLKSKYNEPTDKLAKGSKLKGEF